MTKQALREDCKQCEVCGFDCYLFAVTCECSSQLVTCLEHARTLCRCSNDSKRVHYRYSVKQLRALSQQVEQHYELLTQKISEKSFDEEHR